MKGKTPVSPPPYLKKGFKSAPDGFFRENVPQLGGTLTRSPVVEKIYQMVEAYFPFTERLKIGQMIWYAVDEAEKAGYGKNLQHGKLRPVILDILD